MSLKKSLRLSFAWMFFLNLFSPPAFGQFPGPPKKGEVGRKVVKTPVPDFTLINQDGKDFRFASLRGKVVLVTFVYTTCPDLCPLLTAKFAQIQQKLKGEKKSGYFLLSITTDPDTDKPSVLRAYGTRYGADLNSWAFVTGDKKKLSKVWNGFGLKVKKLSNGQVQHIGLTVLIDREGRRRVNYFGDKWQEKELLKDMRALASEN